MRQAKTLIFGTMLGALFAWASPEVLAQATPSGQAAQPQTQTKTPVKPGAPQAAQKTAGAAQPPAKGTGATAQSQAGKAPAKGTPQPAQKTTGASQPAKNTPGATQSQKATAKAATQAKNKPAGTTAAKAQSKRKSGAKAKKTSGKPAKPGPAKERPKPEPKIARRDPFESLIGKNREGDSGPRLPGKAGLLIGSLRLDGVVRYAEGMIAVVTNAQSRTYFLREGDQLYDGRVAKITMDGVTFHELGKDAFGKPVEREISKRMYPSPGEVQ